MPAYNNMYPTNPYYPTPANVWNTPQNIPVAPSQPTPASAGIIWVQGESGAKAYPVPAGTSLLLMDSESQVFYIKSTDGSGVPMPLRTFSYKELLSEPAKIPGAQPEYVTRSEFEEVKKMLEDLTK